MSKVKVSKFENGNIILENGVVLGRNQHPTFFSTGDFGIISPAVKVGQEIEIPDEAIMINAETGRKYIRVAKSEEALRKEVLVMELGVKKAQIKKLDLELAVL